MAHPTRLVSTALPLAMESMRSPTDSDQGPQGPAIPHPLDKWRSPYPTLPYLASSAGGEWTGPPVLSPTAWPMASGPGLARLRTLAATGLAKWRPSAAEADKPSVTAATDGTDGSSKLPVPSAGAVSDHLTPWSVFHTSRKPGRGLERVQQAPL
jgi:hypothetical protein